MKVVARLIGGLGNQLFGYCAARRLALASNAELVLDDVSGFVRDSYSRHYQLDHFMVSARRATARERLEPFSRLRRKLLVSMNRHRPFAERRYIRQEGIDFDARLLTVRPQGALYLDGYWQSEQYFKDVEPLIRQDLQIIPPSDGPNKSMNERIQACTGVAVHVRFFDAPAEQGISNASGDYYAQAVARMESLVPNAHYFLFSDQPAAARARIPLADDRITLVTHNAGDERAYADLWLMSKCRHFIIANSTFSWWGAWLADLPGKIVIAPGQEMREGKMAWGFRGLLPQEWIKL